jgi:hypothetical protein
MNPQDTFCIRWSFLRKLLPAMSLACMGLAALAVDLDPVLRGKWPLFSRGPALAVAVSGNYAYLADEYAGVQVIDVSKPSNPQRIGGYDTSGRALGVAVLGNYAYVADYLAGLQVIDVSNPANPQRAGGNGSFDAYSVVVSGEKVYVGANPNGLAVLNLFTPLSGPALWFAPAPRLEQNGLRVWVQGLPGLPVQMERSANLREWQSWTNGVLGSTPLEFLEASAGLNPRQFYRAVAP